jgi:BTB/POZ domain/BTB And C-terminal Kelch
MAVQELQTHLQTLWENAASCGATGESRDIFSPDVDLEVADEVSDTSVTIPAHRLILAARSPVLSAMTSARWNHCGQGQLTLDLSDDPLINATSLQAFLRFVYTAACDVTEFDDTFFRLVYLASKYQVPTLSELLEARFCESALRERVLDYYLSWCIELGDAAKTLRAHCQNLASTHSREIFAPQQDLSEVSVHVVVDVLCSDNVWCNEATLFRWARAWVEHARPDTKTITQVMSQVRFSLICPPILMSEVRLSSLAPPDLYFAALHASQLENLAEAFPHIDSAQFRARNPWDLPSLGLHVERDGDKVTLRKSSANYSRRMALCRHLEQEGNRRVTWQLEFSGLGNARKEGKESEKRCMWIFLGVSSNWHSFSSSVNFSKLPWTGAFGHSTRGFGNDVKSATVELDCSTAELRIEVHFATGSSKAYDRDVTFPCRFGVNLGKVGNTVRLVSREVEEW